MPRLSKFLLVPAVAYFYFNVLQSAYTLCADSIYTVDDSQPQVKCIHVHGDRIVKSSPWWSTRVVNAKPGAIVVPGLADAHAHIIENGFKMHLPLDSAIDSGQIVDILKQYVLDHPDILHNKTHWIMGMGWDHTNWPGGQFPTAADLDQDPLLKGRPIALRRVDGHALWVSSKVLELTGPLPSQVEGGLIVRDANGQPTGIFVDNAIQLIKQPAWTDDQVAEFAGATINEALSYGLTSIHDAATEPFMISFFKKQAEQGKLPLHLYLMGFTFSDEYWGSQIPRLLNYGKHARLNLRSVKLFADGTLGSWGAALLEPYTDRPDTAGLLLSKPEALKKMVKQFQTDGFQVNIHCSGDRANKEVLDIFGDILVDVNATEWRPRIEHAQIMTPHDLKRIGELGVIPSVQPTYATNDMSYAEQRLGPERIKGAYAYKTLLQSSERNVLPLGSDFPVEGVNPLLGFYAAVSRLSVDGNSPHGEHGWYPAQRLTRAQALKGMTFDPAYASFTEHDRGSLAPGKKADFVVLDRDIMTVPFREILQTKVLTTVIDGQVVYGSL